MKKTYKIADRIIEITSLYPDVHEYCKDYAIDEAWMKDHTDGSCFGGSDDQAGSADILVDIRIETTLADISFEREKSAETDSLEKRPVIDFPPGYLEELAVYRQIAIQMLDYDTFLFHGSAIAVDGEGYIFTAKSGTGKSTHAALWRELFGDRAVMINDDKPLIRVMDEQSIVYGTPYNGKHRLGSNISVPVKAICILARAEKNCIEEISLREAYSMLIQQSYRPVEAAELAKTLDLIDRMAGTVRFYRLGCNMDISAAKVSYEGMH